MRKKILSILLLALAAIALTACPEKEGPLEKAGEKMDEAIDEAGDKIDEATE